MNPAPRYRIEGPFSDGHFVVNDRQGRTASECVMCRCALHASAVRIVAALERADALTERRAKKTAPKPRPLGKYPAMVLRSLVEYRGYPSAGPSNGGWAVRCDTDTRRCLESLGRRGLAVRLAVPIRRGAFTTEWEASRVGEALVKNGGAK